MDEHPPPAKSGRGPATHERASPSLIAPLPLVPLAADLASGRRQPGEVLDALRGRAGRVEPFVMSLVDERDRPARHGAAVDALADEGPGSTLFGVPVGVKDIFHVDGLPTRAGSSLPPEELAGPQASAVTRLLDAGVVVFAKTVTAEFAGMAPGPTRNPHDTSRTPGGSSSGSAAAVAAGIVPLALGTQTVGSVIRPAAFCGIAGYKPTYGRIPIDGVIPFSPSVDTIGLFTQDVAGLAAGAGVLLDGWTGSTSADMPAIGVPQGPFLGQAEPEACAHFDRTADALARSGARVARLEVLADIDQVTARHRTMIAAEMRDSHRNWFGRYGDRYSEWTENLIRQGQQADPEQLRSARAGRAELRDAVHTRMDEARVDVWICPAATGPAPEGTATGDPAMNLPWTHAGLPVVTIPAGTIGGLPVGLQVVARFGDDERLLGWCAALEASLSVQPI